MNSSIQGATCYNAGQGEIVDHQKTLVEHARRNGYEDALAGLKGRAYAHGWSSTSMYKAYYQGFHEGNHECRLVQKWLFDVIST